MHKKLPASGGFDINRFSTIKKIKNKMDIWLNNV